MLWIALRDRFDRLDNYPLVAMAQFYAGRDPRGYLATREGTEVRVVNPETLEPLTASPVRADMFVRKPLTMYYYRLMVGRTYAIRGLHAGTDRWRTVVIRVDAPRQWSLVKVIDEETGSPSSAD